MKQKEESELRESRRIRFTDENQWLIEVLDKQNGDFCQSMAKSLETSALTDQYSRAIEIMRDIYGKFHGRRNSKAYKTAVDEFEKNLELRKDLLTTSE